MAGTFADPWVLAQIDAAVAPYLGRLPASEIVWMKGQLLASLIEDQRSMALLNAARPRVVEESGEVLVGPPREEPSAEGQKVASASGRKRSK